MDSGLFTTIVISSLAAFISDIIILVIKLWLKKNKTTKPITVTKFELALTFIGISLLSIIITSIFVTLVLNHNVKKHSYINTPGNQNVVNAPKSNFEKKKGSTDAKIRKREVPQKNNINSSDGNKSINGEQKQLIEKFNKLYNIGKDLIFQQEWLKYNNNNKIREIQKSIETTYNSIIKNRPEDKVINSLQLKYEEIIQYKTK